MQHTFSKQKSSEKCPFIYKNFNPEYKHLNVFFKIIITVTLGYFYSVMYFKIKLRLKWRCSYVLINRNIWIQLDIRNANCNIHS